MRKGLIEYRGVADDPKLPEAPRLPQRAAIYIAPDGSVHFGALFEGLVPVAEALGADASRQFSAEGAPVPPEAARGAARSRRDQPAPPGARQVSPLGNLSKGSDTE